MELPIQLKFFRKLELYQELISENKKFRESGTEIKTWPMEKDVLAWTKGHHHLGSPLNNADIQSILEKTLVEANEKKIEKEYKKENFDTELDNVGKNLKERGYAKDDPNDKGIIITLDGLMMGQVVNDCNKGGFKEFKYPFLIILMWATVFSGSLLIILEFLDKIFN